MSDVFEPLGSLAERLSGAALRDAFGRLRQNGGPQRARDAAESLGVSEGELLASRVGDEVIRLQPEATRIVGAVGALGPVMALTRNAHCVHEKVGQYGALSGGERVGLVLGQDIDLRLFGAHWHYGFAQIEAIGAETRRSLQLFDADGTAVHKIYQTRDTDVRAFDALIEAWRDPDQSDRLTPVAPRQAVPDPADASIDVAALRAGWAGLHDTHHFHPLLRRLGVGRQQALRLVGHAYARPVAADAAHRVLAGAARDAIPIMVFVANPGCIQIHTGPVVRVERRGPWLNVLDPGFNLHLREDAIAGAWVVRKPTDDGDVTALEMYDAGGGTIAQLFGARKPSQPECADWAAALAALETAA